MKILILTLFGFLTVQAQHEYTAPKPSGGFAAGRKLVYITDKSRPDSLSENGYRTLPVWIWYPAQNVKSNPVNPLDDNWRREQGKYLDKKIGTGGSRFLQSLKTWAVPDAEPAEGREKFPVLIFGPGHTWLPTDYSALIEDIVSHGYVVIGYAPTGFAGVTMLTGGKLVPGIYQVQQQDVTFADARFVRNSFASLLKDINNADTLNTGMFGHSQGGAASVILGGEDSGIKAVVNLDGDLMWSALEARLKQPALLISNDERIGIAASGNKFEKDGRERSEYRRHAEWMKVTEDDSITVRLRVEGIRHLNFNDLSLVPLDIMPAAERKDKIGTGAGAEALKIIAELTRSWFDAYLKGSSFHTMADLSEKYTGVSPLLWRGIPYHK